MQSLPSSQLGRVLNRKNSACGGDHPPPRELVPFCFITEFVDCPIRPAAVSTGVQVTEQPTYNDAACQTENGAEGSCAACDSLRQTLAEYEHQLAVWEAREADFKKTAELCNRLKVILRFSQLKKDSERLRTVEAESLAMRQELENQQFRARMIESQQGEMERLREIERDYHRSFRGVVGGEYEPEAPECSPPTPPAPPTSPPPEIPTNDNDVSFTTICHRMQQWVAGGGTNTIKAVHIQRPRVSSAPPSRTKKLLSGKSELPQQSACLVQVGVHGTAHHRRPKPPRVNSVNAQLSASKPGITCKYVT